jgi:hypothetical protein
MSSIINGAGLNSFRSQFTAGTTYALAEIIDNSIQWTRSDVDSDINIILVEHRKNGSWRLDEIVITDNGVGMSEDTLSTCLNFGGGRNHGTQDDGKLGKFGLGLPYASCSQSPEYHVYTWEDQANFLTTFRDHTKYQPSDSVEPEPVFNIPDLPSFFYELLPELKLYKSGTIIRWANCDRLDVSQSKTLISHINLNLGRIYRHFIGKGVNISFLVYRAVDEGRFEKISELCKPIGIFDPIFLMPHSILPTPYNTEATNVIWGGDNGSGEKEITFEETIVGGHRSHRFKIHYSIAKPEIQGPDGKSGGNTELGTKFYKKATGISLVRASRELKLGSFGFPYPNGNGDQRHRWWSVEVQFEPISDELLGVNANKLDARNFRYLSSEDYQELESGGMVDESVKLRHVLSKEIDTSIKAMFKEVTSRGKGLRSKQKCPSCQETNFLDGKCEDCGFVIDICPKHGLTLDNGNCALCTRTPDLPMCIIHKVPMELDKCPRCPEKLGELNKSEKEEMIRILKSDYPEIKDDPDAIERTLKWFVQSNRRHFIIFTDLRAPSVFLNHIAFQDKFVIIEVNTRHPFYEHFIQDVINNNDDNENLTPLLLFIASWIESERKDYTNSEVLERFRSSFGSSLMEVIANWHVI